MSDSFLYSWYLWVPVIFVVLVVLAGLITREKSRRPKDIVLALPVGDWKYEFDDAPPGFHFSPVTATFSSPEGKRISVRLKRPFCADISIRKDANGRKYRAHYGTNRPFVSAFDTDEDATERYHSTG